MPGKLSSVLAGVLNTAIWDQSWRSITRTGPINTHPSHPIRLAGLNRKQMAAISPLEQGPRVASGKLAMWKLLLLLKVPLARGFNNWRATNYYGAATQR